MQESCLHLTSLSHSLLPYCPFLLQSLEVSNTLIPMKLSRYTVRMRQGDSEWL
jgi:hypothetical protein